MSTLTAFGSTFSHIDPGPIPDYEDDFENVDVDMLMEDEEMLDSITAVENQQEDASAEHNEQDTRCTELRDDLEDDDEAAMSRDPLSNADQDRIVIAIDFGTTFSSVAYAVLPTGTSPEHINLRQIRCIGNYPGYEPLPGVLDFRYDVPTELWYDDGSVEREKQRQLFGHHENQDQDHLEDSDDDDASSTSSDEEPNEGDASHSEENGLKSTQQQAIRTTLATQYWGYEVQKKLNTTNIHRDEARPLTRFKLNLQHKKETKDKRETQNLRTDIRLILRNLTKKKIIHNETDIYTDYLTHLLRHTKAQLSLSNDLRPNMLFQFVLCVPAKWPMNGCRIMQSALERAVEAAEFGEQAMQGVQNIFMISEPEAAAECILAESNSEIYCDETMVIVDAGGGTVDAVTYKCDRDYPLRLSEEAVAPDSLVCGASFINEKFEKKLLEKIAKETYLVKNGKTLKSIAQAKTTEFENYVKRTFDTTAKHGYPPTIYIDDLRENEKRGFFPNNVALKRKTVSKFFEASLFGVRELLQGQLELAESGEHRVQKVILTGGFSQSPSLQSYLRKYLEGRRNIKDWDIELIVPTSPSTSVARGAVLRALNKRFGPSRITQCSYGFLLSEPYEPKVLDAHRATRCTISKADGERYVDGTIRWVINAGDCVQNLQVFRFEVYHTFPITKKHLLCAEQIWMSDRKHESHYRKTHTVNKGAELIGSIETDLTFLKDEGYIKPRFPSESSKHAGSQHKHWEAHYEILMIVEGRSIRFEARWPAKKHLVEGQSQRILGTKFVGIAAAFPPGTL